MTDIFIGYRRGDGGDAGRLYDHLQDWFGADKVFRDIETLHGGQTWRDELEKTIRRARVNLFVIGQHWLSPENMLRLNEQIDVTRNEIRVALECRRNGKGNEVISILVGKVGMPNKSDLPPDITDLTEAHAHELPDTQYESSVTDLITLLQNDYGLECKHILEEEKNKFKKIQALQDMGHLSPNQAEQIRFELAKQFVGL